MAKFDDMLQFKVEPDMKIDLQRAADEDGELLSTLCRRILRDYLRSRVFLPAVPTSGNTPKEPESVAA